MTTLIGIQGDGYALLATDSRVSTFDTKGSAFQYTTLPSANSKIASNGKYLIGAAGDVRAINIIQHAFHPPVPAPTLKGKKMDAFITAKFIPALRSCFDEQGYSNPESKESVHIAEYDSTVILAVNGYVYLIEGDYSWTPDTTGIYAAGTGSAYALGALSHMALKSPTPHQAKKAAITALAIAAKYDPYTGSPYHTYVQESA